MNNWNRVVQWIDSIIDQSSTIDPQQGVGLMQKCGASCASNSLLLEGAVKIHNQFLSTENTDKLFEEFKRQYYDTPRLSKHENEITLIFDECTCPLVKEGIYNSFLCNCTTGYTRKIFETLFNQTAHVELKTSILRGDKICKQVIRIS